MPDIARARPDQCGTCRGRGYTHSTATEMVAVKPKSTKLRTEKQGSGCPECLGTGKTRRKS
jgi:hypothetical protein